MIAAFLLTAASVAQLPSDLTLPHELEPSSIQLSVQTTNTHFRAQSYSDAPMLIVFGAPGSGMSTSIQLAPGMSASYTFCRGCLDDVYFEVLSMRAGRWSNTGALALADVCASDRRAAWIQTGRGRSVAWLQQANGLESAQPDESLLPASLFTFRPELDGFRIVAPAMHVPVVTPENKKGDAKPPAIEPAPLPPV
ncbi:MAG: hypothetical protein ACI8QZ_001070 [Chlamydiales bacterium]|jgi:hypothetical protein